MNRHVSGRILDRSYSRPAALFLLAGLLLFQGVSGVFGGAGLVADPTGSSLGLPAAWLEGSPFPNYLIPGVVLLVVLGVFPLLAAYGVWCRRRWGRAAGLGVGVMLLVWIGVEIAVIGYHSKPPLQLVYGLTAVAISGFALAPSVRRYANP